MLVGGGLVGALLILFWVWAILDVIATDESLCRSLPKGAWLMVVIFLSSIGALAWLLLGRPEGADFAPGSTRFRTMSPQPRRAPNRIEDVGEGGKTRSELRAEYDELDRRLLDERAARREEVAASYRDSNERAKQLAEWEQDLLRREKEMLERKRRDESPPT